MSASVSFIETVVTIHRTDGKQTRVSARFVNDFQFEATRDKDEWNMLKGMDRDGNMTNEGSKCCLIIGGRMTAEGVKWEVVK